jgi:P27 family predicted phage terminase small subunit
MNHDETPTGTPSRPPFVEGELRTIWDRVVRDLVAHDLCAEIDGDLVGVYCQEVSNAACFTKLIIDHGGLTAWYAENPKLAAAVDSRRRRATQNLAHLGTLLGLTPVGRKRLAKNKLNVVPGELGEYLGRVR